MALKINKIIKINNPSSNIKVLENLPYFTANYQFGDKIETSHGNMCTVEYNCGSYNCSVPNSTEICCGGTPGTPVSMTCTNGNKYYFSYGENTLKTICNISNSDSSAIIFTQSGTYKIYQYGDLINGLYLVINGITTIYSVNYMFENVNLNSGDVIKFYYNNNVARGIFKGTMTIQQV
jgi:hypothetical protein